VRLREIWQRLHDFCAAQDWRGYDPYDGLNSLLARFLPGKGARQAWTQFHKRSPINFRALCGIKPRLNSTAVALFAMGSADDRLLDVLDSLRTPEGVGISVWLAIARLLRAAEYTNLICTALAVKAYRRFGRKCDTGFVEALVTERGGERWIRYIPQSDTQVHNINLMGAALLGRRDCVEFSVKRQRTDGSWWYGEAENQRWIDNFHTGYNLVALREYEQASGDASFADAAQRGFAYWDEVFWLADGCPRYYHNQTYPIDVHCCAQGILTYLAFGDVAKAEGVARWR